MGDLLYAAFLIGGGLLAGWLFIPAPTAVTDWWAKHGWGKRTIKS